MADGGMQLSSQTVQQLHKVFIQFCSFGAGQRGDDRMDSAKFQKFNKDMNLMTKNPAGSRSITRTDLDLIFTRVKAKGERKIDFNVFLEALYQIAETKRTPFMGLVQLVISSEGAKLHGATVARPNAFHDDKSKYTGVHGRGGPTTARDAVTMDGLMDRSDYDYRGRKVHTDPRQNVTQRAMPSYSVESASAAGFSPSAPAAPPMAPPAPPGPPAAAVSYAPPQYATAAPPGQQPAQYSAPGDATSLPAGKHTVAGAGGGSKARAANRAMSDQQDLAAMAQVQAPPDVEEFLVAQFNSFCSVGGGRDISGEIDGSKFTKLLRDSKIFSRDFTTTDADLIFTKAKGDRARRKITFHEFRYQALPMIAQRKRIGIEQLIAQLSEQGSGPVYTATLAEPTRFHDDRSTYTGVYSRGGPQAHGDTVTLETLADRTPADSRGRKLHY